MTAIRRGLVGFGACVALLCLGSASALAAGAPVLGGLGGPPYGAAAGGYSTTIQGSNFEGVTAVDFGATPATFYVHSSTEISVTVPAGSGVVDVRVTTGEGTSEITPADRWVYTESPEYGRCKKLPSPYEGEFYDHTCNNPYEGEGNAFYEWHPAFGRYFAKTGFTLSGASITLETAQKQKLVCSALAGAGEYTSDRTLSTGSLTLSGCALSKGSSCQSAEAGVGEIVTEPLGGQVGTYTEKFVRSGVELAPASGETLAEFSCGTTAGALSGAVILEASENKMAVSASWKGKQKKGVQTPAEFQGGSPVGLRLALGSTEAPAGLKAKITQTNEEELELKA